MLCAKIKKKKVEKKKVERSLSICLVLKSLSHTKNKFSLRTLYMQVSLFMTSFCVIHEYLNLIFLYVEREDVNPV